RPPNADLREREYLTPKEVDRLQDAARKYYGHRDATAILIAYRHGLRASELCELTWNMIEVDSGDRLTTLPHGLRVFVEALLHGLQHILMLPARDAPLHAGGAALLERTVATRICPIASQLLPVLLVRVVVLQLFASRTAIRILVAKIDKVLLAEATLC